MTRPIRVFDAVSATLSLIETNTEIGTTISTDGQTRKVLVARFPYQLVYRLKRTEIVIVAVVHVRRRPGTGKAEPDSRVRGSELL